MSLTNRIASENAIIYLPLQEQYQEPVDAVSAVVDRAGRHTVTQSTVSKRPVLEANALNGNPAFRFDGGNGMVTDAIDLSGTNKAVIASVCKNISTASGVVLETNTSMVSAVNQVFNFSAGGRVCAFSDGDIGNTSGNQTPDPKDWRQVTTIHDTTQATPVLQNVVRLNGVDQGAGVSFGAATSGNFGNTTGHIGSRNNSEASCLIGWIAELVLTNDELTAPELASLENYLMFKYGLGGTSASWLPTDLGVKLELWISADFGVTTSRENGRYRVTPNLGRASGAPAFVKCGDGVTASKFPTQLTGKRGMSFDGGDYLQQDMTLVNGLYTIILLGMFADRSQYLLDFRSPGTGTGFANLVAGTALNQGGGTRYTDGTPTNFGAFSRTVSLVNAGITLEATKVYVGATYVPNNYVLGDIYTVALYTGTFTPEEVRAWDWMARQRRNLP